MQSVLFLLLITFFTLVQYCHSVSRDAHSKAMEGLPGVVCQTRHQCSNGLKCTKVSKTCGGLCNEEFTKSQSAKKPEGAKCQIDKECLSNVKCKHPPGKRCMGVCDINECSLGTHSCHGDAECSNTVDSYTCTCKTGFSGDGYKYCLALYTEGRHSNGVYQLSPDDKTVFDVYCDMDKGGWTLIQRRVDDSVNFSRGWDEYVNGFGNLSGNFWLGLKYLHLLSTTPVHILFEVVPKNTDELALMQYSDFFIDNSSNRYKMHVNVAGTYNDVAQQHGYYLKHGFGFHNGRPFSTWDRPDEHGCVNNIYGLKSGWWYANCFRVNLNTPIDNMRARGSHGLVIRSEIKIKRV